MQLSIEITWWVCPVCGITYGGPKVFTDNGRWEMGTMYCPNGHAFHKGWPHVDVLQTQLENAEQRRCTAEETTRMAEATNVALRGVITKLKRRLKK